MCERPPVTSVEKTKTRNIYCWFFRGANVSCSCLSLLCGHWGQSRLLHGVIWEVRYFQVTKKLQKL